MNRILARVTLLSALAGLLFVTARAPAEDELSVQLYKKNVKSCVVIHAITKEGIGRGSGSLIDAKKRLVLTNWHVVEELPRVYADFPIYVKKGKDEVMFQDPVKYMERAKKGEAIGARVLHRDKSRDLAIIQLDRLPPGTTAIPLARKSANVGETSWNIGSPGRVAQLFSITEGKVRAVGPGAMVVSGPSGDDAFEVKAMVLTATNPTNPGDSGGPLFDKRGYQIAVTQSGLSGVLQVNSFIDVTEVRAFLHEKKIEVEELSPPEAGAWVPPEAPKKVGGTAPAKDGPAGAATSENEKAAQVLLRRAKVYQDNEDQRSLYIQKLQEVVKMYPGTTAAKEAQKALGSQK